MIKVSYPDYLANVLKLDERDFEVEMKTSSLVKLFELGKISSGVAAKVLGLSRIDFLELLAKYNVSILGKYSFDELNEDIENA